MDWSRGHRDSQRVLVPPSRHISTSFQDIVQSLKANGNPAVGDQYQAVAEQLDFATLHDFQIVRRRLKESFKPFNDAALHVPNKLKDSGDTQIDKDEVDFLEDLYALLKAAHFRTLSLQEWQAACDNDFTFTNPMDVAWSSLDKDMLSRFWNRKDGEFKQAACISDRALVMHRGIKLSHARGKFYQEKIDLLVEYLIANPLEEHVKPFLQKYKISWQDWWPTIEIVGAQDKGMHRRQETNPYKDPYKTKQRASSTRDPLLNHENAKWVTRVTLKDVMPDASRVCSFMFKEIHLQEPTFKDAILLYRRDGEPRQHRVKDANGAYSGSKASIKKQLQPDTFGRNIYIKRFHDIPNADLEMIFPDKAVYLKPVLLIQLMFTIVLGLVSVLITLITSEATWSVLGGILSVVGTRAYQVYTSATIGRQKVLDDITDRLYEQTMDAQDGVIYFLLDEMADQHVKELLLAYFLLLDQGRPMTQRQLDKACEDFLRFQFAESLDFALENSLPTLIDDGLIHKDSQGLLHAASLEESRKLLSKKGSSFFQTGERQFKSNIPTFSRLSSRSLQRYMKTPNSSQQSLNSMTNESKPPTFPKAQQSAPAPSPLSQSYLPQNTNTQNTNTVSPVKDTNTVSNGNNQVGVNGASLPGSYNQGVTGSHDLYPNISYTPQGDFSGNGNPVNVQTAPSIEYEDDIARQSLDVHNQTLNQTLYQPQTGDLRSRTGHSFETFEPGPNIGHTSITGKNVIEPDVSRF